MHVGKRGPAFAAIAGAEDIARLLIVDAPSGDEEGLRILRINGNVVEHEVVALAQMRESRPAVAAVA